MGRKEQDEYDKQAMEEGVDERLLRKYAAFKKGLTGELSRDVKLITESSVYKHTISINKTIRNVLRIKHGDKVQWLIVNGLLTIRKKPLEHPNKTKGDY